MGHGDRGGSQRETSLERYRRVGGFREHVEVDGWLDSLSWCEAAPDSRQQCSWKMNRRTQIVVRAVWHDAGRNWRAKNDQEGGIVGFHCVSVVCEGTRNRVHR